MKILLHDYGGYPFTHQLAKTLVTRNYFIEYVYSVTTQSIQRTGFFPSSRNFLQSGINLSHSFAKYSYLQRWNCEIEHGQKLASKIITSHPDIVISANAPLDVQRQVMKASHEVGAKFIFWLQDAISEATRHELTKKIPLFGTLISNYYTLVEKNMVKRSDRVILISDDFVPLMKHWGVNKERITIIPNWAPLTDIPVFPKQNPWAATHNLEEQFVFLFSGILGLKHNPEYFIQLSIAFKFFLDVKIVIVAEGAAIVWLKEQKEKLNLDNLLLFPYQPAEVYPQMLGASDVLMSILNSEAGSYSVPSKVLSYMCAGRPLLLSVPLENLAARLVIKNDAGKVSSPLKVTHFVDNAKSFYFDRQSLIRMGNNARKYAQEFFNIERITDKFESLF